VIAVVALVALVVGGGCRSRDASRSGASCDAVGARFLAVARAQLASRPEVDAALRTGIEDLLAPMRDGMVRACSDGAWTPAARDCFAAASDDAAMKSCYQQLSPAQQQSLATHSAGDVGSSAAAK
jgi:hypothetical protein